MGRWYWIASVQTGKSFRITRQTNHKYTKYKKSRVYICKKRSCKCKGNRCQVCFSVSETETFTSTVTHTLYEINHSFNCNDKSLTYLLTGKTCLTHYVGRTTDCFRHRWNNYKSNDRKYVRSEVCLQEHLFEHFNSNGYKFHPL